MNIIQNAIKHLEEGNYTKKEMDIAIKSLKKQLPVDIMNGGFCPTCRKGHVLSGYCHMCGQKLNSD